MIAIVQLRPATGARCPIHCVNWCPLPLACNRQRVAKDSTGSQIRSRTSLRALAVQSSGSVGVTENKPEARRRPTQRTHDLHRTTVKDQRTPRPERIDSRLIVRTHRKAMSNALARNQTISSHDLCFNKYMGHHATTRYSRLTTVGQPNQTIRTLDVTQVASYHIVGSYR